MAHFFTEPRLSLRICHSLAFWADVANGSNLAHWLQFLCHLWLRIKGGHIASKSSLLHWKYGVIFLFNTFFSAEYSVFTWAYSEKYFPTWLRDGVKCFTLCPSSRSSYPKKLTFFGFTFPCASYFHHSAYREEDINNQCINFLKPQFIK